MEGGCYYIFHNNYNIIRIRWIRYRLLLHGPSIWSFSDPFNIPDSELLHSNGHLRHDSLHCNVLFVSSLDHMVIKSKRPQKGKRWLWVLLVWVVYILPILTFYRSGLFFGYYFRRNPCAFLSTEWNHQFNPNDPKYLLWTRH